MSVAFLPIDSTKDSLDTATAIAASTTIETNKEEDSFDTIHLQLKLKLKLKRCIM